MTTPPLAPPLDQFVTTAHEIAMQHKIENVADGSLYMPFVVSAFRGSTFVCTMLATGRDEMLWCLSVAVGGFSADRVSATMDAYSVSVPDPDPSLPLDERWAMVRINPDTGKDFEAGDLQRAFEAGRPWVTEHMSTFGLDKASGEILGVGTDYVVTGTSVVFDKTHGPDPVDKTRGIVPDALLRVLGVPDMAVQLDQVAAAEGAVFDLTPKQKRAHTDAVVLRHVLEQSIPLIYGTDDEEIKNIIEESMERAGQPNPFGSN